MKVRQPQRGEQRSDKSRVPVPVRVSEVVEDVANPNPFSAATQTSRASSYFPTLSPPVAPTPIDFGSSCFVESSNIDSAGGI